MRGAKEVQGNTARSADGTGWAGEGPCQKPWVFVSSWLAMGGVISNHCQGTSLVPSLTISGDALILSVKAMASSFWLLESQQHTVAACATRVGACNQCSKASNAQFEPRRNSLQLFRVFGCYPDPSNRSFVALHDDAAAAYCLGHTWALEQHSSLPS